MPQDNDAEVTYHVRDELPGGVPAIFAAQRGRLDVIFARSATANELAEALGPMYAAMTEKGRVALRIAAVAVAPLTSLAFWVAHFSQSTSGIVA